MGQEFITKNLFSPSAWPEICLEGGWGNLQVRFPATSPSSDPATRTSKPFEVAQQSQRRASFDRPPDPDSSACGVWPNPRPWLGSYSSDGECVLDCLRTYPNIRLRNRLRSWDFYEPFNREREKLRYMLITSVLTQYLRFIE